MRIIFLNRYFWPDHSATSLMLSDLAFHLAARGADVMVVTSRLRYEDPQARLAARELAQGVRIVRLATTRFGRVGLVGRGLDYLTFYASALVFLLANARADDCVVAKTDPPMLGVVTALAARIRRFRRANWLQDLFPEIAAAAGIGMARGWTGRVLAGLRDWSLRGATNVAIGESMARRIHERGVGEPVVLANWADGTAIQPLPRDGHPLRAEWGLENRFVVAYSGNLGRVHEAGAMVDAAEILQSAKDVTFLFVGGGSAMLRLRDEVARRQLANAVFRGYEPRERLGLSLTVADIHLVGLRPEFEGLVVPSKFYGIAAAGRPCLFMGDVDGEIGRVLLSAGCGLVVGSGDGRALASAILTLREDPARLAAMGAAARAAFDAGFDKGAAFARWEAVFRRMQAGSM